MSDKKPTAELDPIELAKAQQNQAVQLALQGGAPSIYGNTVAIAQSGSDVALVLLNNNNPVGVVSLSYITAKTMLKQLQIAIDTFEKATKTQIKTIDQIVPEMMKVQQASDGQKH